ncbi:MAG: hypothetical protein PUC82_01950 [bacterium]|nr:hypothetical protein [bacterium]
MNKKQIVGISMFVVLVLIIIFIKVVMTGNNVDNKNLTTVYVATGGGKEDFIADEEVNKILKEKYGLNVVFDSWSNGKTVTLPLIRESVGLGNQEIIDRLSNGEKITINTEGVSKYDALFTSDQRFYDYYKLAPNSANNESDRYMVLDGGLTLNTPIVIYSWKEVANKLIDEGIVTKTDEIYYITDMNKLIDYILSGKTWNEIGLSDLYGTINISSTDPVSSSPGATYYGLLLSILGNGQITDEGLEDNLAKLKQFYQHSGYMNNTPADLFERYLKTGMGGAPMIVDYEKSLIDFANSNPNGFLQVKDDIVVLYPKPTIWNSHCFAAFSDSGKKLYQALQDADIQQIAFEKYGFRTGITGGNYDVSSVGIAIPKSINSTVSSLKMDYYNRLIDYLKN